MTFEQAQLRKTELDEILDFLFKGDDLKDRLMRLKVARNEMNDPRYRADIAMVAVTDPRHPKVWRFNECCRREKEIGEAIEVYETVLAGIGEAPTARSPSHWARRTRFLRRIPAALPPFFCPNH